MSQPGDRHRRRHPPPTSTPSSPSGPSWSRCCAACRAAEREVVALRYLADLPEADVARALGCSVGTVKQHASRGLAALPRRPRPDAGRRPRTARPHRSPRRSNLMLDQLDDPVPFTPSPELVAAARVADPTCAAGAGWGSPGP